jgi:hypothetical protein
MRIVHCFLIDKHGTITHTRGDTGKFSLNALLDGVQIETFNATFSVKEFPEDTNYLYQVHFNQDTACNITHELTANVPFGTYWWDIQVTYVKDGTTQYKTIGAYPYILKPDITV